MKNRINLLLNSALSIIFSSSLSALPCPELGQEAIKWRPHWTTAHLESTEEVGRFTYTWESNAFSVGSATVIRGIHLTTGNADHKLSCKYEVDLDDSAHKWSVDVDVFISGISGFEPTSLDAHKAQELVDAYNRGEHPTITEGGYTWTLETLSPDEESYATNTTGFKVSKVLFKGNVLRRDAKGTATIRTDFKFFTKESRDRHAAEHLDAKFISML